MVFSIISIPISTTISRLACFGVLFCLLQLGGGTSAFAQNDPNVVMHKVEKGQTLFGIARKYQASVSEIRALNDGLQEGLKVDQVIKVPVKAGLATKEVAPAVKPAPLPDNSATAATPDPAGRAQHVVGVGQTLGMIAKTYKTTVAEILKWNNMTNPNIRIGQRIIVGPPVAMATAVAAPKTSSPSPKPGAVPAKEAMPESIAAVAGAPTVGKESGLVQQVEKGLAEGIDQDDNNKQQCLHRTAAIGSVLKVKNDLNGLSVYAKVVGKLPEIGPNEKLVVRLSKSTFEKLMPSERRFPVTITYSQQVTTSTPK